MASRRRRNLTCFRTQSVSAPAETPFRSTGQPPDALTHRAFARLAWDKALAPAEGPRVPPAGWWEDAFTLKPTASESTGHRCGQHQMLTLVAYDISDPKRLQRIARICEDWGVRVQYSVFECRLEADRFERFWEELKSAIEPKLDRIVAYKICLSCSRDIKTAGSMVTTEQVVAYVC